MRLRHAKGADVSQLLDLEEKSFPGDRISGRSWQALIGSPSAVVLVVARQRSILGVAVLLTRRGTRVARLYSIAVAEAARGAGVGHALITQMLNHARKLGCVEMRLESRADNRAAHRLFRNVGFEEVGPARKAYYHDGENALRFCNRLISSEVSLMRNL